MLAHLKEGDMSCEKFLNDIKTQVDIKRRKEAKEEAIMKEEARELQARQEYYETCLEKAREEIASCFIPEDLDGSLYKDLKDEYNLHSKLLRLKEDGHIPNKVKDSIVELILNEAIAVIMILALAAISWFEGILSIVLALLLLLLWVIVSVYLVNLFKPSIKKRLQIAAECKAICEILESRS